MNIVESLIFLYIAPENDNFDEVLKQMRRRLGWVTELPRHGAGCKVEIEKLLESPDIEEDEEV